MVLLSVWVLPRYLCASLPDQYSGIIVENDSTKRMKNWTAWNLRNFRYIARSLPIRRIIVFSSIICNNPRKFNLLMSCPSQSFCLSSSYESSLLSLSITLSKLLARLVLLEALDESTKCWRFLLFVLYISFRPFDLAEIFYLNVSESPLIYL